MYKKQLFRNLLLSGAAFTVALMAVNTSAYAQNSERANVFDDEIVVTARRKEETLASVPIAVSAFNGEQLEALGVTNSGDVAALVPNLTWNTEFGRATPQVYLRGVGSNNFAPTNAGPVGIYQDGVIIGPNIVQGFAAFDLDRVEVLKGPQGTLFGRNSTGGLINFVSKKPVIGGGKDGYISAEVGSWGTFNFEGASTFQIGDNAAARLSLVSNNASGEYSNVNPDSNTGSAGAVSDYSGRLQLAYDNDENFSALVNIHGSFADPDVTPFIVGGTFGSPSCANNVVFGECATAFGFVNDPDPKVTAKQDDLEQVENIGGFVELKYDFGGFDATLLAGYDESSIARLDDVDESPASDEFDHYVQDFETFSAELRFSGETDRLDWHLGGYYFTQSSEGLLVFDFPTDTSVFGPGTGFGVGNLTEIDTDSFAVFAQGVWTLTDRARLTTGIRYTTEEVDVPRYVGFLNRTDPNQTTIYSTETDIDIAGGIIEFDVTQNETFNRVTGRLSLDYQLTDDSLVYASYARGFKGGDVNGVAVADPLATQIARPETVDSFELGIKSSFPNANLKFNAAAFYLDYQDQQQAVILAGDTAAGEPALTNAASSKIPGFEADITWTPTDAITILGAIGYIDAKFSDFVTIDGDFSNNRIPLVSDFQASLVGKYDFFLENDSVISAQLDGSFQSEQFFTAQNDLFPEVAALREGSYILGNASLSYSAPGDDWSAKVFVRNIANKEVLVSGFGIGGFISIGGALTINFD